MLNFLWIGLVVGGVVLAAFSGKLGEIGPAAFDAAKNAVMTLALPLGGLMSLWLGFMRLAEKAGLIQSLAGALRPVLRQLFPDVPVRHPAMGAMVMNIAANMLGLSNAATPLGLRAMQHLQKINPHPGTASNAMCTFLAINTSSVQIIPATAVAILATAGATQPSAIIGSAFLATLVSTAAGLVVVKTLEKWPRYRLPDPSPEQQVAVAEEMRAEEAAAASGERLSLWKRGVLLFFAAGLLVATGQLVRQEMLTGAALPSALVQALSLLAVPALFAFFPLYAALKRVPVYEEFVEGAKEGIQVALRVIPFLVAILAAIAVFRAAGGVELVAQALAPLLGVLGVPVEVLPLMMVRPLSGSGALGIFSEIVQTHGGDSFTARLAGTILGSTETTFYVLAVYFGSVAVRRTRHAVPAGLAADFCGMLAAVLICRWLFL